MNYTGVIIKESLKDSSIIQELVVLEKNVERVTEDANTPWLDVWTMYDVIIDENKMDEYAKRLSNLIDTSHCSDWYCDFKNDKYYYVIFAGKVFKINRESREELLDVQNYALGLGLIKEQLPEAKDMPTECLVNFLIKAKKNTYASMEASRCSSSKLGFDDYIYEENFEGAKVIYHDTSFGSINFMGQEVVYCGKDVPKWGMTYYSTMIDDNFSKESVSGILKKALAQVGSDGTVLPVRGPSIFEDGDYKYTFKSEGTMFNFEGKEEIFKNGELVYRLYVRGGIIR